MGKGEAGGSGSPDNDGAAWANASVTAAVGKHAAAAVMAAFRNKSRREKPSFRLKLSYLCAFTQLSAAHNFRAIGEVQRLWVAAHAEYSSSLMGVTFTNAIAISSTVRSP